MNAQHSIRLFPPIRKAFAIVLCVSSAVLAADAATHYQLLKSFGSVSADGATPLGGLVQASDGAFYGTTATGGSNNLGTVFKLNEVGSAYAELHSFNDTDGANPEAALLEGSDGGLYGTCSGGGSGQLGAVFRLSKDGSRSSILHSFSGNDGANPQAALIEGSDGTLYGRPRAMSPAPVVTGGPTVRYSRWKRTAVGMLCCCLAFTTTTMAVITVGWRLSWREETARSMVHSRAIRIGGPLRRAWCLTSTRIAAAIASCAVFMTGCTGRRRR